MTAKRISILGSTGSVGTSTLEVIAHVNAAADEPVYDIEALAAGSNVQALAEQAIRHKAKLAVIADEGQFKALRTALEGHGVEAAAGDRAVCEAATRPCHRLVATIVGIAGLPSTFAAVAAGNNVALANKESLVCAAGALKAAAQKTGARLIPMDSEHSAIFQVLQDRGDVEKLTLTASGGPFLNTPLEELGQITVAEARNHPKWSMGLKISIDSASMMNKALEVIEAAYLFNKSAGEIDVVVHPQSIIHSMVTYQDGSVLAQLGEPDMRTPIAYALSWPESRLITDVKRLNLADISRLDFQAVDHERFPAIGLALQALETGGCAPLILNCANEAAVAAFIAGTCRFIDIGSTVKQTLEQYSRYGFGKSPPKTLDEIAELDIKGRQIAQDILARQQVK